METDKIVKCNHCESDICYVIENTPQIKTYSCLTCGFTTNSLMKEGEEFLTEQLDKLPELYKDVIFKDKDGLVWMPTVINNPKKGMIFYNGTNKLNAKWASVKAVEVTEKDKHKYPNKNKPGEFYEWRMAMETIKAFEKNQFMEALDYIGLLQE